MQCVARRSSPQDRPARAKAASQVRRWRNCAWACSCGAPEHAQAREHARLEVHVSDELRQGYDRMRRQAGGEQGVEIRLAGVGWIQRDAIDVRQDELATRAVQRMRLAE